MSREYHLIDSFCGAERLQFWVEYLRKDLEDLSVNGMRWGICLSWMKLEFLYVEDFYDFIEDELHLCRSTVTKFITVFLVFSDDGSMFFLKRWREYSYRQLEAALPLIDHCDLLNKLRPDMTIAQIKALEASLEPPSKLADIRDTALNLFIVKRIERNGNRRNKVFK